MKKLLIIGLILALCILSVPVAASISHGSESSAYSDDHSLTISSPSGVVAGHFLIAQIYCNSSGAGLSSPIEITPPSPEWILSDRENYGNGDSQAIYYKFATAGDVGSSFTWNFPVSYTV
jgi:hypothetical protein